jgi:uncharacterized metal-binding protein YceD (DUF177 family)
VDWRRNFYIQFEGLKEGLHHFDYEVEDTFFSVFEGSLIEKGTLNVHLDFEKKSNMMVLDFSIEGTVITDCDRCGDPMDVPLKFNQKLIVKYGDEGEEPVEDLAYIPHSAYELDVAPFIYEFTALAIPLRNVHPKGKCNKEALKRLEAMNVQNQSEVDPRWSKLNELKTDH